MTDKERNEIIDYLTGPRDHQEGAALYRRFGVNLRLKRLFSVDMTATTREIMLDELRHLAGLTEEEFRRLPRLAKRPEKSESGKKHDELRRAKEEIGDLNCELENLNDELEEALGRIEDLEDDIESARSEYKEAPEAITKMIRFREKYPFLNSPDCPDELKILVADMFTAYGRFKEAHARLRDIPDEDSEKAFRECEAVVEEYLRNREIWEELDYYREHGSILGKAAKFREAKQKAAISELTDLELVRQLQSASVNVSKHKKAVALATESGTPDERAEAALARWTDRKRALQEEAAARKKK